MLTPRELKVAESAVKLVDQPQFPATILSAAARAPRHEATRESDFLEPAFDSPDRIHR